MVRIKLLQFGIDGLSKYVLLVKRRKVKVRVWKEVGRCQGGESGGKRGRICTHLWVGCCCSWRKSQRCCWMPWQARRDSVEPSLQSVSTNLRGGKSLFQRQKKKKNERPPWRRGARSKKSTRGLKLLELWDCLQPRISGLCLPQESQATSLQRAADACVSTSTRGEWREARKDWRRSSLKRCNSSFGVSRCGGGLTRAGDEGGPRWWELAGGVGWACQQADGLRLAR